MLEITPPISEPGRATPLRRPDTGPRLSFRLILSAAAGEYDLEPGDIKVRSRNHALCEARYLAWWAARKLFPRLSTPRIGQLSGGFDHSTVVYGLRQFRNRMAADATLNDRAQRFLIRVGSVGEVRLDQIEHELGALERRVAELEAERAALLDRMSPPSGDRP